MIPWPVWLVVSAAFMQKPPGGRGKWRYVEGDNPELHRSFEPFDPTLSGARVTELHVVFSNHLDIGFNVRAWCDGPDGCTSVNPSKLGNPCRPWAYWVLNENINTFLPRAVATAEQMPLPGSGIACAADHDKQTPCCGQPSAPGTRVAQKYQCPAATPLCKDYVYDKHYGHCVGSEPTQQEKYIYMTQPWVASFYLDCDNTGMLDWRNLAGGGGPPIIDCPNASSIAKFKSAVANGSIFWQAFPHNAQPGTYDAPLFESSLQLGAWMADELGVPRPQTFSQRDETGMTRAILPLLKKHNVTMISLGSGGSAGGHPIIPDLFIWRDPPSGAEVLFAFDHGYGGGTHILPNGHALYCAWNTDNGGPQSAASAEKVLQGLRQRYPGANVHASTFEQFSAAAKPVLAALPVITSEIGDTWLYGVPSDPLKNVWFREFSRIRADCVNTGRCNTSDATMRRFDRLLTKIPEHTWGEDTTWYLHDYNNWTNEQLDAAMHEPNYNMTVQSWREQRSYLLNAPALLRADQKYVPLAASLDAARLHLSALTEPPQPQASGWIRAPDSTREFKCKGAKLMFGSDGSIAKLIASDGVQLTGALGKFTYQTLDAADFTAFDRDYGNGGCGPTTENPGCHNFNKPNMSACNPQHTEMSPNLTAVWVSNDGCSFAIEGTMPSRQGQLEYGEPEAVWTRINLSSISESGLTASVTVNWVRKRTTRLAEASWISFTPDNLSASGTGWRISSLGTEVDPLDVVEHGAVHLHAMGPDGAMIYRGPDVNVSIASLDAPVVSCGILSPFPTPGNKPTPEQMAAGMHWNVQNNIWNTNYPQWYPFEGTASTVYGRSDLSLGANAAFRFVVSLS